ncbi:MAG: B-box zinc finger protein [Pyrinomonadaceae bacterium]
MYCAYHSTNPAAVKCTHCARALCQSCDHRVRGFPFCQDCIVSGVEALQQQKRLGPLQQSRRKSSPLVAGLLSVLVPGLGAAYNGQISKAIFHFALFASLFQLSAMSQAAPFFMWGVFGVWMFAIVDAYRTAQLLRAGLTPKAEEDAITTERLHGNPLAWGAVLVALGSLILLHTVFNVNLPVREILPVALIVIGGYMAVEEVRQRQARSSVRPERFDRHSPPPSVVDFGTERARLADFANSETAAQPVEQLPFKT